MEQAFYKVKDLSNNMYLCFGATWDKVGDVFRDEKQLNKVLWANMHGYKSAVKAKNHEEIKRIINRYGIDQWVIETYIIAEVKTDNVITTRQDKIESFLKDTQ